MHGKARRVIHTAVYTHRANGVGAWLRALDAESRRALAPLAQASWEQAMDELELHSQSSEAEEQTLDDGDGGDGADEDEGAAAGGAGGGISGTAGASARKPARAHRRRMPKDVRAVEQWLASNGALRSACGATHPPPRADARSLDEMFGGEDARALSPPAAPARADDDDDADPTRALDERLQPRAKSFASSHFARSTRGQRTLEALGRELTSGSKQRHFAEAVLSISRNRIQVPGGGAGGGRDGDGDGDGARRAAARLSLIHI